MRNFTEFENGLRVELRTFFAEDIASLELLMNEEIHPNESYNTLRFAECVDSNWDFNTLYHWCKNTIEEIKTNGYSAQEVVNCHESAWSVYFMQL